MTIVNERSPPASEGQREDENDPRAAGAPDGNEGAAARRGARVGRALTALADAGAAGCAVGARGASRADRRIVRGRAQADGDAAVGGDVFVIGALGRERAANDRAAGAVVARR